MNRKKTITKENYNICATPASIAAADRMSMKDGDSRSTFIEKLIRAEAKKRGIEV